MSLGLEHLDCLLSLISLWVDSILILYPFVLGFVNCDFARALKGLPWSDAEFTFVLGWFRLAIGWQLRRGILEAGSRLGSFWSSSTYHEVRPIRVLFKVLSVTCIFLLLGVSYQKIVLSIVIAKFDQMVGQVRLWSYFFHILFILQADLFLNLQNLTLDGSIYWVPWILLDRHQLPHRMRSCRPCDLFQSAVGISRVVVLSVSADRPTYRVQVSLWLREVSHELLGFGVSHLGIVFDGQLVWDSERRAAYFPPVFRHETDTSWHNHTFRWYFSLWLLWFVTRFFLELRKQLDG